MATHTTQALIPCDYVPGRYFTPTADSNPQSSSPQEQQQRHRGGKHRFTRGYGPVMTAMLMNNTMNDCQQVSQIYADCQASGSNDRICEVATHYMELCLRGYVQQD